MLSTNLYMHPLYFSRKLSKNFFCGEYIFDLLKRKSKGSSMDMSEMGKVKTLQSISCDSDTHPVCAPKSRDKNKMNTKLKMLVVGWRCKGLLDVLQGRLHKLIFKLFLKLSCVIRQYISLWHMCFDPISYISIKQWSLLENYKLLLIDAMYLFWGTTGRKTVCKIAKCVIFLFTLGTRLTVTLCLKNEWKQNKN